MTYVDIIFIFLLAVFVIGAMKSGFLKSIIEFAGVILSIPLSWILSEKLAEPVFNNFFREKMITFIGDKASDLGGEGSFIEAINNAVNGMSSTIKSFASATGFDIDSTLHSFNSSFNGEDFAAAFVDKAVKPLLIVVITMILFLIVFSLIGIIIRVVAGLVGKLKLPGVADTLNKVLGGVFGLLKGAVIVVVFAFVAGTVVSLLANTGEPNSFVRAIDNSAIVNFVDSFNPYAE